MTKLTIFLLAILFCANSFAQPVLEVEPGFGTLNDAIANNQGNVIYKLKAGQWYGINAVIENDGFPLTIIGEVPSSKDSMLAMLQIGSDATGVPFTNMFNIFNNLTLKNIFIVDANENDVQSSGGLITLQNPVKVTIDNVVIDPLSTNNGIVSAGTVERPSVFFTNSQVIRSGQQVNPNDGVLFQSSITGDQINQWDTLYIENNTFVCTGTWFIANLTTDIYGQDNFVWINHNTFVIHKSQLYISYYPSQFFFTNNLLFDFNTQPYNLGWNIYYPDGHAEVGAPQSRLALVNNDTLPGENLPSIRKCFVEYNLNYRNPKITEIPSWGFTHTLNFDGVTPLSVAYLMPLYYPKDSGDVNREANMFNSSDFPYFKAGNTMSNDPQFTQTKIYDLSDSLAVWTLPAAQQHCWGFDPANILPLTQWPKFWWNADDNGLGNPTAWPRFDGTYTNQSTLTGSIAGLPLGDLNWYPDSKAKWEANKETIQAHIIATDTNKIPLTGVATDNPKLPTKYSLSQNYPNPFNPSTLVSFSIPQSGYVTLKVYNLLGQEVATLINKEMTVGSHQVMFEASNLASGVYLYRLSSNGVTLTKKMMLMK